MQSKLSALKGNRNECEWRGYGWTAYDCTGDMSLWDGSYWQTSPYNFSTHGSIGSMYPLMRDALFGTVRP